MSALQATKRRATNEALLQDIKKTREQESSALETLDYIENQSVWDTRCQKLFTGVQVRKVWAQETELSKQKISIKLETAGHDVTILNACSVTMKLQIQKDTGSGWTNLGSGDKVTVSSAGILALLNKELQVRTISGETVNSAVINISNKYPHLTMPEAFSRRFDKKHCERELEKTHQIIKSNCYSHVFANTSDAPYATDETTKFGLRGKSKKINFTAGGYHAKTKDFAEELKAGKVFSLELALVDPIFDCAIFPASIKIDMDLSYANNEVHKLVIENYTKLADENASDPKFRIAIVTSGDDGEVYCRQKIGTLTSEAYNRFMANYTKAGDKGTPNAPVPYTQFLVHHVETRDVTTDSTRVRDLKPPNTTMLPFYIKAYLQTKDDYTHEDARANAYSNLFKNIVKKITYSNASTLNPQYRLNKNEVNFKDKIDTHFAWEAQKSHWLGIEGINHSTSSIQWESLNGSSGEVYENIEETRERFGDRKKKHTSGVLIDLDPTHGNYAADRKQPVQANPDVKWELEFYSATTTPLTYVQLSAYPAAYALSRVGGNWNISYVNKGISSTSL